MVTYKKVAGVVICFNRPDYVQQTFDSLVVNTEVNDIDWFVFQDGGQNVLSDIVYAEEDDLDLVEQIIKNSGLPIAKYFKNNSNLGPGQQRYRALSLLNEYDLLFCFDDDMVVSKYYLRLLRVMAEQFPECIGIMNRHTNKGGGLRRLEYCGHARLWGHYMNQKTYKLIEEEYTNYYNHIKKIDFHNRRAHPDIRTKEVPYILDDVVVNKLCRKRGVKKLWPFVTRGRYIGREGTVAYKTAGYWKKKGMDNQPEKIQYPSDNNLKSFRLRRN